MANIQSYLTFNGNCLEAMIFYQECLGGELMVQTVGDLPLADPMPPCMKQCVLHATLVKNDMVLTASDMVPETGLVKGNSVSLLLNCKSEAEAQNYYDNLAAGGDATHPLSATFWGATFGDLTDKFGNQWLINCER